MRVRVSGQVQGVWFRAGTAERAADLGLAGWVRNLADGRVELEAEGEPDAVRALVAWCAVGTPAARVDRVESEELPATGAAGGFRVER